MAQRGLKWTTIGVYLRRVRAVHKAQNMSPLWSSEDVRQALRGVRNSPPNPKRPSRNRVPVTPFLLLKIKKELSQDKRMSLIDKRLSHVSYQSYTSKLFRLFWLFCTWAYVGAFRSADLLAEETQAYRPGSTLCFEHVTWHCEKIERKSVRYLVVKV